MSVGWGGQFGKAASFPEQGYNNWTWWSMPVTPALRRPRQEDWDFRTSAGPCLKNKVKVNQSIKVLWMKLKLEILYLEPRVFGGDQSLLKSICKGRHSDTHLQSQHWEGRAKRRILTSESPARSTYQVLD